MSCAACLREVSHDLSCDPISCVASAMDTLDIVKEQLGWGKGHSNPTKGMQRPLGEGPMGQPMAHPQTGDRQPMAKPSAAQQKGRLLNSKIIAPTSSCIKSIT